MFVSYETRHCCTKRNLAIYNILVTHKVKRARAEGEKRRREDGVAVALSDTHTHTQLKTDSHPVSLLPLLYQSLPAACRNVVQSSRETVPEWACEWERQREAASPVLAATWICSHKGVLSHKRMPLLGFPLQQMKKKPRTWIEQLYSTWGLYMYIPWYLSLYVYSYICMYVCIVSLKYF